MFNSTWLSITAHGILVNELNLLISDSTSILVFVALKEEVYFTRKMLVLPVQVGVLLREFSIGDFESVDLSLEGSLLGSEGLVLGGEVGILLGEGSIVVLQLAVPLGEVLDNDLGLGI